MPARSAMMHEPRLGWPRTAPLPVSTTAWAEAEQLVTVGDSRIKARLHQGESETYLWVLNMSEQSVQTSLTFTRDPQDIRVERTLWGAHDGCAVGGILQVEVPALDAVVLQLAGSG